MQGAVAGQAVVLGGGDRKGVVVEGAELDLNVKQSRQRQRGGEGRQHQAHSRTLNTLVQQKMGGMKGCSAWDGAGEGGWEGRRW